MIDVKQAAQIAIQHCREVFSVSNALRFEEFEADSEDGRPVWRITVSWPRADVFISSAEVNPRHPREYKVVVIDKGDGSVLKVKMHELSVC